MMKPTNIDGWTHNRGYHLNADGKSIEYIHDEKPYRAIIEGIHNEDESELNYYTVVFDTSEKPWVMVEPHEIFQTKDSAFERLLEMMETNA